MFACGCRHNGAYILQKGIFLLGVNICCFRAISLNQNLFHQYSDKNLICTKFPISGVSFLYNADVMTSAKIQNCLFLLPASTLAKYFNLRIHQCSISMVFSLFLRTAHMWLCVQTQYVQITLWCLNFSYSTQGRNSVSTSNLNSLLRMHQKALF